MVKILKATGEYMKKILIADDHEQILDVLKQYACKEGYEVYTAKTGTKTLEEFERREFDAVLLDVMMPEMDGFEVCRQIRSKSMVPIIMITARGEDFERIMGLDLGADDYVVKPFSPSEVMARLRAVLRRINAVEQGAKEQLVKGNLSISMDQYQVKVDGQIVRLTKKETEILWLLSSYAGTVFTRDHILDSVWGCDYYGDERTVDTHIKRLRAKVEKCSRPDWEIVTVRGVGYKFEVCHE